MKMAMLFIWYQTAKSLFYFFHKKNAEASPLHVKALFHPRNLNEACYTCKISLVLPLGLLEKKTVYDDSRNFKTAYLWKLEPIKWNELQKSLPLEYRVLKQVLIAQTHFFGQFYRTF